MKAKETGFLDLFNQRVQYLVPRWQRRYRWAETEIHRLIDDMLAIADAEDQERPHYGGTMITVLESAGVMKVHRVVDGQQRLTTVSILLARIAELLGENGMGGELTGEGIRHDLLTNRRKRGNGRRKLRLQDGDEEEYHRIIDGDSPGSGEGAVARAWRIVRRRVDAGNVQSLIEGLHRLRVIAIGLEDHRDDAQQIFESLNTTGKPLTEGEKVKNWLLMGLSEDVQNELHDEHWLTIEGVLSARHDAARIDEFLCDVMRWRTGRMVAGNRTYDEFRRWAIREGCDNPARRPELCGELASLAALYGQLTGTAVGHPSQGVRRTLGHLRAMGIDAHRPFTLRLLWDAHQARESGRDPKWLSRTLGSVSSWITRLWLAGRSFTGLGNAFVELASVSVPAEEPDRARLWDGRIAGVGDQRIAVPSDSEVNEGIRLTSQYGGKNTRATRAVLCAMMCEEQWDDTAPCGKLTVEHIMPQTLSQAWRDDLGERADEIHGRHLHRLGNLTLCGGRWGSALSNHRFERKKPLYEKSTVLMTRELAKLPTWDEAEIGRRAEELWQHALRLWPWTTGS